MQSQQNQNGTGLYLAWSKPSELESDNPATSVSTIFAKDIQLQINNAFEELEKLYNEQSATRSDDTMNNDDFLSKYIEKVDRDQSDLRQDIRESERRITEHSMAMEQRMDNRLNRIEDMIAKQQGYLNSVSDKFDQKIEGLSQKIDNNNKFVNTMSVTVSIGVVAIAAAVIIGLFALLPIITEALKGVGKP